MKLNLTKPLIVFDLETTGLDMIKDRIIQISYIKVMPDGTEDRKNLYVNPCKEIPAEVVALTGISNEDVKDAPTFKQLASTLEKEFTGCDFAGYQPLRCTDARRRIPACWNRLRFQQVPSHRCADHLHEDGTP